MAVASLEELRELHNSVMYVLRAVRPLLPVPEDKEWELVIAQSENYGEKLSDFVVLFRVGDEQLRQIESFTASAIEGGKHYHFLEHLGALLEELLFVWTNGEVCLHSEPPAMRQVTFWNKACQDNYLRAR